MANDVLAHVGNPDSDVVAKPEEQGQATRTQTQERTLELTVRDNLLALHRRMDDVLELLMPPEIVRRDVSVADYNELTRENKELKISLYIMAGLFFLMLLARR